MITKSFAAAAVVIVGCAGVAVNAAHAQVPPGTLYVFNSKATGTCPALDWHVVAGTGGQLSGMISWDEMKSMARATGVVGADRNFKMTATEVGGAGRTATITGQARSDGWLVANIIGPNIDCKNITVPIYRPSSGGGG